MVRHRLHQKLTSEFRQDNVQLLRSAGRMESNSSQDRLNLAGVIA